MRILLYTAHYHPEPIGTAPLMTELAEGLANRGHQVTVITAMPNYPNDKIYPGYRGRLYEHERRHGVDIERCFVMARANPGPVRRLLFEGSFALLSCFKVLSGPKPDVVLCMGPPLLTCFSVAALQRIRRCATVLSLQSISSEAAAQTGRLRHRPVTRLFQSIEKFACKRADRVSLNSPAFFKYLSDKGIDRQKLAYIPNWVDTDFIAPLDRDANAFRYIHSLEGKFVVLYSGDIARTQNIETVICAAAQMRHYPHIQFVIVGEQRQLKEINGLCQDMCIENVILRPLVHRANLPKLLAAADVLLVLQKRTAAGFNMPAKIPVMMASGRPIVASVPLQGRAAQVMRQSEGGLVVAPENPTLLTQAIQRLHNEPQLAMKLGQQGRQFALAHYSYDQALNAYEALLEGALNPDTVVDMRSPTRPKSSVTVAESVAELPEESAIR